MAIQFFRNRSAKLHVDIRRCSSPLFVPLFIPAALALTCCKAEKITSLAKEMKGGLCSSNAKAKLWRIKVQEAVEASKQKDLIDCPKTLKLVEFIFPDIYG